MNSGRCLGVGAVCLVFLLSSCASVPYRTMVRSHESSELKRCLDWTSLADRHMCLAESSQRCREQGLEAGCGIDGVWDGYGGGRMHHGPWERP